MVSKSSEGSGSKENGRKWRPGNIMSKYFNSPGIIEKKGKER